MSAPLISRIDPPQLDDVKEGFHSATIRILGKNFSPSATAVVVGSGTAFDTIRIADECRLDMYGHGGFVLGLIVLNDPDGFSSGSSSNVLPLRIIKTIPRPETDESIPF